MKNKILVLLVGSLLSVNSFAETNLTPITTSSGSEKMVQFGLLPGIAVPMGSSTTGLDPRFSMGLNLLFKVNSGWGIGPYFFHNKASLENSPAKLSMATYGVEASALSDHGFIYGLRVGFTTVKVAIKPASASGTSFSPSAMIGYNQKLNETISLGFEAAYSYVFDSDSVSVFSLITPSVALKFAL